MSDSQYLPFEEQLLLEAKRQRDLLELEAKRTALYAEHIAPLDEAIKANKAETEAFRTAMITHVRDTGDISALPERVNLVLSKDWTWNDEKMLAVVKQHAPDLVRVKESLVRIEVKKLLEDGVPEWAQEADPVKADNSYVTFGKLGDLLIRAEVDAETGQGAAVEETPASVEAEQGEPEKEQAVA